MRVDDSNSAELLKLLLRRTIVDVTREPTHKEDWSHGNNSLTITLDNGTKIELWGWGHDASGLEMEITAPSSVDAVAVQSADSRAR